MHTIFETENYSHFVHFQIVSKVTWSFDKPIPLVSQGTSNKWSIASSFAWHNFCNQKNWAHLCKASSLGINTWPNDVNGWKNSTFTPTLSNLCNIYIYIYMYILCLHFSVFGNHRRRLFVGVVNPCKLLVGPGEGPVSFAVAFERSSSRASQNVPWKENTEIWGSYWNTLVSKNIMVISCHIWYHPS